MSHIEDEVRRIIRNNNTIEVSMPPQNDYDEGYADGANEVVDALRRAVKQQADDDFANWRDVPEANGGY